LKTEEDLHILSGEDVAELAKKAINNEESTEN